MQDLQDYRWTNQMWINPDGIKFNVVEYTDDSEEHSGEALILLHGFTGSAANWQAQIEIWGEKYNILALDIIGHGLSESPADAKHYTMQQVVDDFYTVLDWLYDYETALLGYSMGGRMALQIAVAKPELVSALILESASPGLKTEAERAARIVSDNELADFIEREGIEAFVDRWENLPLFASQKNLPPAVRDNLRAQRLKNNPVGLANSLRGAGTGAQPSLWEELPKLKMPVLLIAGELDGKFCAIAREMQKLIPQAQLEIVAGAGHTVHLEQPKKYNKLVMNFLDNYHNTDIDGKKVF